MIDWQKFNVNVLTAWYVLSFASPSYVCMFFVSADKYLTCFLCTVLNLKIFFKGFFNNSAFCGVKFTVFSPDFLFVILHIAAKFRICVFFWILILYNHRNGKFNQIESTKQRSAGTYKNSAASAGIKKQARRTTDHYHMKTGGFHMAKKETIPTIIDTPEALPSIHNL